MARLESDFDKWATWAKRKGGDVQAHSTLFRLTCMLLDEGRGEDEVLRITAAGMSKLGRRDVPERELRSAIIYAKQEGRERLRWPKFDPLFRSEIEGHFKLGDLIERSASFPKAPYDLLEGLFKGDPLICMGRAVNIFECKRLDDFRHLAEYQYIVPNPMTAERGKTMEGKASARTNSNTGPRKYQVCEFDFGSFDAHAALLIYLSDKAPLCMAVYSGGKSLHGWFDVGDMRLEAQRGFFAQAVELGADSKMWTPSQFSRMPLGINQKSGRVQQVYFYNVADD
jgi:hypothetical protein